MQMFIVLLAIVSIFLLLIKLLASFTGRLSERMITGYFQSAESLLERDILPADWSARITTIAKWEANRERLNGLVPLREAAKPYLMKKIKKLYKFLEKCPFLESAETRDLLLSRLEVVIDRWEKSDLSEILHYYCASEDNRT
jgi:hypothetical protein